MDDSHCTSCDQERSNCGCTYPEYGPSPYERGHQAAKDEAAAAIRAFAEREKELVDALAAIHNTFTVDIIEGYRTKDKEFAVSITNQALVKYYAILAKHKATTCAAGGNPSTVSNSSKLFWPTPKAYHLISPPRTCVSTSLLSPRSTGRLWRRSKRNTARSQGENMSNIEHLNRIESDEHAIRAACMNAVLLRCNQLGRAFFSAEDARAVDMTARTLMYLEKIDVPDAARLDAPQTLPQHAELKVYSAVEAALSISG